MDRDIEKVDLISVYGSINSHNIYQLNGLKQLMNYNDMDGMEMNANLKNGDLISGIVLTNIHTIPPCNK